MKVALIVSKGVVRFLLLHRVWHLKGASQTIRSSLETAIAEQRDLKAKLDALKTSTVEPRLPTEEEVLAYVVDVEARIKDDPASAREALRRLLLNGRLVMHPQPDGSWRGESAVFPMRLAGKTPKPQSGGPSGASGIATDKVEIGRCAGPICPLDHMFFQPLRFVMAA